MASSRKPVGHLPRSAKTHKECPAGFAYLPRLSADKSSRTAAATNLPNHAAIRKKLRPRSRNKAGAYTFIDLLSGGWDLAKNVLRVSRFGRSVKIMVLADLAATAHAMGQRDFSADAISASVSRIVARADPGLCEEFCRELLIDGVIARSGEQYYFSHLSFQEFLTAKYMAGDPSAKEAVSALSKFISGDDWWLEVLRFYMGISQNPESFTRWIMTQVERRPGSGRRAEILWASLGEFFPSFSHKAYLKKIGRGV